MKSLLSDRKAAQEFFNAFLPNSVKEIIDISSIEHVPGSFLSRHLKATYADMIFHCPMITEAGDQELYLCLIVVEHKSNPDKFTTIQMGGYLFDAYRKQLDQGINPLRIVLPFLYYHGSESWDPPEMADLFPHTPQDLKKYLPNFELIFKNIQHHSDEQIRQLGSSLFTSAILAQKYSQDPEELKKRIEQIFSILDSWEDRNLFHALSVYVYDILQVQFLEFSLLLEKIPKKMKTEILSLGDRLRAEGREKWKEEGREEGREEMIRRMLLKNAEVDFISEVAEVSREHVLKIWNDIQKNN